MNPQSIPWVIEKVRGIRIIVKNAGKSSSIRPKLSWPTLRNIVTPTRIKTGAVAYGGTIPANGARKKHGRKQSAVKTLVRPVRPPLLIPPPNRPKKKAGQKPAGGKPAWRPGAPATADTRHALDVSRPR